MSKTQLIHTLGRLILNRAYPNEGCRGITPRLLTLGIIALIVGFALLPATPAGAQTTTV